MARIRIFSLTWTPDWPKILTAGEHRKGDEYFVPRSIIGTPGDMTVEQICRLLFPDYARWIAEQRSNVGDKSKGALHFLTEVIPFLSEVIVQDGIYWVKYFPFNPATRELISRMEDRTGPQSYLDWAKVKRKEVADILQQRVNNEHVREANSLEIDAVKIIGTRQHELNCEKMKLEQLKNDLIEREKCFEIQKQVHRHHEEWLRQQYVSFFQPFQQIIPVTEGATQTFPPQQHALPAATENTDTLPTATGNVRNETEPFQQIRLLRTNANNALKPTILPLNAYSSLENLVNKRSLHLHDIILGGKKMKKDDWANVQTDPNNWSRIKILYQRVKDHQDSTGLSIEDSAKWLDVHEC